MLSKLEDPALAEVSVRVHSRQDDNGNNSQNFPVPLDVLWTRKAIQESPLAAHVSRVKDMLRETETHDETMYDSALGMLIKEAQNLPLDSYSQDLVQMTENATELLREIMEARAASDSPSKGCRPPRVTARQAIVSEDAVKKILDRAGEGSSCTKSKVVPCSSPAYAQVMEEFGLSGVAAYPVFLGCWWMSLQLEDFNDWRKDYISILDYCFFLEYNVDKVNHGRSSTALMRHVLALWDMPHLSSEMRLRRAHMLHSMSFFDLKRRHESEIRGRKTDGLTTWVHSDRDMWRDFKALDSAGFAHFLSFAKGVEGRDDMMIPGLVNDWVDLGPDLRYEECNQSVFALTRGSLALEDLLLCYERTVWMLNASFVSERRRVGSQSFAATCIWQMCNHRQDVWRYYSLAFDLCSAVEALDLYKVANLADCYTPDLLPKKDVANAGVLRVSRRRYSYRVCVDGTEYSGGIELDREVCDAVQEGLLPKSMVDYQLILPHLLRQGQVTADTFLHHMDSHYCAHFVDVMRSGHGHDFSRPCQRAIACLVMEEWRSGLFFAMGIGSLIDARPDYTANDRPY
ncbi:hypothetical protein CP533_1121 [Ophiocordyceps camponoti-saundersi (nom. inval.)]|nr:hypothetical protein CP533_1121 [Ophiocordyceps camponoti-saundersi (nom. inval.)]